MIYEVLGCNGSRKLAPHATRVFQWTVGVLALQFMMYGITALFAPGYLFPWLQHPVGRIAFAMALGWELCGWLLLYLLRPRTTLQFGCALAFVIVVFAGPIGILPMLGPSVDTIMQATGPVHTGP